MDDNFIQLHSGIDFHFLDPDPEDINIYDIAHTLSLLCRFGGHCTEFYSVAEHSVRCSLIIDPEHAFEALMHDATEAYLVDMPRPIKNVLKGYRDIESRLDKVIRTKFGLPKTMTDPVKFIDDTMLATERRDLMPPMATPWVWLPKPDESKIDPWSPKYAKTRFLERFNELTIPKSTYSMKLETASYG